MGDGIFDGAYLVENFENLNPANTFWDKYYHLYANVDTEPPRFLEFERWWGGFYLMNREEIEWITRNLFVGNKVWKGGTLGPGGKAFDLRDIKAPIVLFASMGDNITPPQQAFNWVADVYGSTDEIKARGQVIVGLVHENIGHLGIFVSGKVAKKEHAQIVVGAEIDRGAAARPVRDEDQRSARARTARSSTRSSFEERRLEDIVGAGSIASSAPTRSRSKPSPRSRTSTSARTSCSCSRWCRRRRANTRPSCRRQFHPLRMQRWALSDLNPWLAWVATGAEDGAREARDGRAGQRRAQAREDRVDGDQRLARLLPRDARRDERGRVLHDLRQRVLAVRRRQARGGSGGGSASPSRASCRS